MKKDEKEVIENILSLYFNGELKAKYNIEDRRSTQDHHPQAMKFSGGGTGGKTNNISREVEKFIERKDQAGQVASFLGMLIKDVKDALETVKGDNDNENYKLLKLSYIKKPQRYTDQEIADEINLSLWTVRYRRKKLLEKLHNMIALEYYLENPLEDLANYFRKLL